MDMANLASYFDNDALRDGYDDTYLFDAQFASYDGTSIQTGFVRRRTLSAAMACVPPSHSVVKSYGDRWVLGAWVVDGFHGEPIRKTTSAKLVTDYFAVLTPGQAASRTAATKNLYANVDHLKDTVNSPTDSDYDAQFEVHMSAQAGVVRGAILKSAQKYLLVREGFVDADGFLKLVADSIGDNLSGSWEGNPEVAVATSGAWDPVTETAGVGQSTTGLLLDFYKLYDYVTNADEYQRKGDRTLLLANSVTVAPGDTLTISGRPWKIVTKQPLLDAWQLHVSRM